MRIVHASTTTYIFSLGIRNDALQCVQKFIVCINASEGHHKNEPFYLSGVSANHALLSASKLAEEGEAAIQTLLSSLESSSVTLGAKQAIIKHLSSIVKQRGQLAEKIVPELIKVAASIFPGEPAVKIDSDSTKKAVDLCKDELLALLEFRSCRKWWQDITDT